MKNVISNHYGKLLAVMTTVLLASGTANAALDANSQAAVDSISTYANVILAAVWPIATVITVGFVGIKLFRKGVNKAT